MRTRCIAPLYRRLNASMDAGESQQDLPGAMCAGATTRAETVRLGRIAYRRRYGIVERTLPRASFPSSTVLMRRLADHEGERDDFEQQRRSAPAMRARLCYSNSYRMKIVLGSPSCKVLPSTSFLQQLNASCACLIVADETHQPQHAHQVALRQKPTCSIAHCRSTTWSTLRFHRRWKATLGRYC